ncbi:MFS transporter [Paenibacillus soyae]|uniref:MFS transporter n=1 Tax=Paenibacillus soyae TaxID=2969249 RepID=A0A9X2MPR8_9BACL|nr:MFS transporter [Paenibacillus soyae]MCR2804180.1 MFS transporter [Paenibacillus soyae]
MKDSWKIYMLAVVSFLVGTSEFLIAGILDKVASDIGVTVAAAGQLITAFSIAFAFGTPIIMALTAKMDRKKLLLASLGVFVAGNLVAVLASDFLSLLGARIVMALGTGVFIVVSLTVAAKLAAPGKQASAIATLVMGFSFALIVGVPIGRVVASAFDWTMNFAGIGILGLIGMAAIYRLIPGSEGEPPVPIREQLALLRQPRIAVSLAVTFLWIAGYSVAYTYISPFLLTISGLSEQWVSGGLFAFGIASLIGSKLGGFGTDKWGVKRTLLGGMALHGIALLLLTLFAQSAILVLPILMLWAFAAWSSGPTQQYYLMTLTPGASGIMLSLNSSVLQIGMAAGAGVGGVIVESASLSSVSWLGAVGVALAALTAVASFRLTGKKTAALVQPAAAPGAGSAS